MSLQLIKASPDLSRLLDEGYALRVVGAHLIVDEIPYFDAEKRVRRGAFVCPLDATSERALPPVDHVMSFAGELPHDRAGNPLSRLGNVGPRCNGVAGLDIKYGFSNKPKDQNGMRSYRDYHEKVTTYEALISGEVYAFDSKITAKLGAVGSADDESPFVFPDSASARAGTSELAAKLAAESIAIIGLGGTGSYILDHVAKTPVKDILLIDNDAFYPHNAFRSPGAPDVSDLQPPQSKVVYHARRFGLMKRGIRPVEDLMSRDNFHLLDAVTFAFLNIDPGPEKTEILDELERRNIDFVDSGMGLHIGSHGIGGTLRSVLSAGQNRNLVRRHIPTENGSEDRLYGTNIQVSDLNSLNANMAVQLWKSHRGFYANFADPIWVYQVESRQMIRTAA